MLDARQRSLRDANGRVFDLAAHQWYADDGTMTGRKISATDALRWLQRDSGHPRREPVGVVGGRRASADGARARRTRSARRSPRPACAVLCGGRGGVMRAACEGVASEGGISIGLLPGDTITDANDAVTVPLATGLGYARNAVIARASMCLVSIGGSYGTLSELALAMQGGKACSR